MNVHEVKSIETKSILSRLKSKDNYGSAEISGW